jgi:hypothetical protein
MNKTTFKTPELLIVPQEHVFALIGSDLYTITQFEVKLNLPITIATIYKDYKAKSLKQIQEAIIKENKDVLHNTETSKFYYDIKTMMFHCAWLGEVLLLRLKDINDNIKSKGKYDGIIDKFIKDEGERRECKVSYERLDFMGHKKLLNEILKEFQKKGGKLPFERKEFSSLFHDVINQRNAFTHGHLFLLKTDVGLQTILDSHLGKQIIEATHLNSYNECFNDLLTGVGAIKSIVDKF